MEKYVAITGGIGSGKTLALGIIKKAGYKVFSADEVYRDMLRDADFVKKVCSETGVPPIYEGDRLAIDRKAISALVFSDREFLKKLNSVTHPEIMMKMRSLAEKESGVVFAEVPLLFEGGFEDGFDFVIVLSRDEKARVKSAALRDGKREEDVEAVAKSQYDYGKLRPTDKITVINNDGDEKALAEKILSVAKSIGETA